MPPVRPVSGPGRATRRALGLVFALAALALIAVPSLTKAQEPATPPPAPAAAPPIPPPLPVPRLSGEITLDGDLSEPAWQSAAVIDQFFETFPADNTEPAVKTLAYLTYDDRYFYIGIHAFDPDPAAIRAPYVERDAVHRHRRQRRRLPRHPQRPPLGDRAAGQPARHPGRRHLQRRHRQRGLLPRLLLRHRGASSPATAGRPSSASPSPRCATPSRPRSSWGILVWRNYPRD